MAEVTKKNVPAEAVQPDKGSTPDVTPETAVAEPEAVDAEATATELADETANTAIVHETLRLFGWQRCLFASNFPVAGLRIGFGELVEAMWRMLAHLPPAQQHAVMAGNALRVYRIPTPPSEPPWTLTNT